jgi:hypothetical protein
MADHYTTEARDLSRALRAMHKALVGIEMSGSEADTSPRPGAYAQMQRLLHDPSLEWLKPLSTLIVELDHLLSELGDLDAVHAAEVRGTVEDLFGPSDPERRHGLEHAIGNLTAEHPEVAMALGDLRRALSALPDRTQPTKPEAD